MDKGISRPSAGTEIAAETEMDPCKHAVPDITFQVLGACIDHCLVICKQVHHISCCKLDDNGNEQAKSPCNADSIF